MASFWIRSSRTGSFFGFGIVVWAWLLSERHDLKHNPAKRQLYALNHKLESPALSQTWRGALNYNDRPGGFPDASGPEGPCSHPFSSFILIGASVQSANYRRRGKILE